MRAFPRSVTGETTGRRAVATLLPLALAIAQAVGCASGSGSSTQDPLRTGVPTSPAAATPTGSPDMAAAIYRRMGLIAAAAPVPFVASVAFFATASSDTTLVIVSAALPNRGLTFTRTGARYEATYDVTLVLRRGITELKRVLATEVVRVATFSETKRTDESVIFQQRLRVPPGAYAISLVVADGVGGKASSRDGMLTVPQLATGSTAAPVVVYEATPRARLDSTPRYVARPRASATYGVDTTAAVYIESYGGGSNTAISLSLTDASGTTAWRGSVILPNRGALLSGTATVPLTSAGIGVATVSAVRAGTTDTARTHLFIGFGADLPVVSFESMISYLRYFATSAQLQALRAVPVAERGATWAAFLRETDPVPSTPQNEALDIYFDRIREANTLFRDDFPAGWTSDRGSVYVSLGAPDDVYEQQGYVNSGIPGGATAVRVLVWNYRDLNARIVFRGEQGSGRWRLTSPSAALVRSLIGRRRG